MKRCSVKPYEGEEKYIFVSYCHKDRHLVFPIIEQMAKDGYRIWYDEGIDPGSEWPEIIAKHLNGGTVCLAFISENSLNSHNCRREVNFALMKKKFFISVILRPVQMSLGMEMQLSAAQSIFKYTLPSEQDFFEKLYGAGELKSCLGEPDPSVVVSTAEEYLGESCGRKEDRSSFSDKWFVNAADTRNEKAVEPEPEPEPGQVKSDSESEPKAVEREPEPVRCVLKREKTGETIQIRQDEFILGRSESQANYVIRDNHAVSRNHASIFATKTGCFLADNHSLNKTFLNGRRLEPEERYALKDGDVIKVYNEIFVFKDDI